MLGLKKSVALLAITVLLFTTLFAMVGAVLADEAGPSDQAGSTDVQVQENQTKPVDEIDNQVSQPVTSEPAGYQEPTLNVPVATTPTDNVENKVEQNTAAQTPPAIDQGGDQSAGSQNGDLPADNGSQYEDKVEVNKPLESNGGNTENGLNSESESRNSEGQADCDPGNHEKEDCSIAGRVFNDENENGHFDGGETGLSNVPIHLSGDEAASIVTDSEGHYRFDGLKPGNYTVGIEVPGGWTCTTSNNPTSVSPGSWPCKNAKVDFGCHFPKDEKPGTIYGNKFNDKNGNGRRDKHEPGIEGIKIWAGDKSAVTDGDGDFWFEGLKPGPYAVREECPQGWTCTTGSEQQVTLKSGCEKEVNFGNQEEKPASISGYKFNDKNGNGIRDPGEPGIPNVLINLWYFWGHKDVRTDSTGHYSFNDLDPALYKVEVDESTAPAGMTPTTPIWSFVCLKAGEEVSGVDFGNMTEKPPTGSISGYKFNDLNGNGIRDPGEPGIPNVLINLWYFWGHKDVRTDSTGHYSFNDLDPALYKVEVDESTAPAGMTPTTPIWSFVCLKAGEEVSGVDFGNMTEKPPTGSITGNKFKDSNGNGKHDDGEPPMAGVDFYLTEQGKVAVLSTATSGADGSFVFSDVAPGTYVVHENVPAGYYQTGQKAWTVTLAAGETKGPFTFFNAPHCTIKGTKYIDTDASGTITGTDALGSGVKIYLTGTTDGGAAVTEMTPTDANGNYSFTGLEAGTYTVTEDPALTPLVSPAPNKILVPGQVWDDTSNKDTDFLNPSGTEVSPEGPITPETPISSVEPTELGSSTPTVLGSTTSNESLPGTGINELPLLFIAGFLVLAGILFLAFGIFRRRRLDIT